MNIQGFQRLTLLDYPGKVACTVFTGGCNLRCPFCHNAPLVLSPAAQRSMEGEVLSYLQKRRGLLDGVCVTGGEPLLHPELPRFLSAVRAMGYLVKLDTNGTLPAPLKALLVAGLVDYVAMDIKAAPEHYALAAGTDVDLARVRESVDLIRSSGVEHEFRTTVVRGIHTQADFEAIGQWLEGAERYFLQPFRDSGDILSPGCVGFSHDELALFLRTVQAYIPAAALRGE